jgi:hypothetical protein
MHVDSDRVEEIFGQALGLTDAARANYLSQTCAGDTALRQRLDALLAAHEAAASDSFLPLPDTDGAAIGTSQVQEGPGARIGRYKLIEQIGHGGFGIVFLAEQEQPVRRRVALKIIKLGMDAAGRGPVRGRAAGAGVDGPRRHRQSL